METFGDIPLKRPDHFIQGEAGIARFSGPSPQDSHRQLMQGLKLEPSAPTSDPVLFPAQAVATCSASLCLQNLAPQNLSWNWTSEPKVVSCTLLGRESHTASKWF